MKQLKVSHFITLHPSLNRFILCFILSSVSYLLPGFSQSGDVYRKRPVVNYWAILLYRLVETDNMLNICWSWNSSNTPPLVISNLVAQPRGLMKPLALVDFKHALVLEPTNKRASLSAERLRKVFPLGYWSKNRSFWDGRSFEFSFIQQSFGWRLKANDPS